MGRQRSLARERVRSTLPDRGKGWKWSPTRRENGIGWSTDRPSQLHFPHSWRLVRLHPVLSDKLLVIDEEGVYDPGLYNDRLLLGFKGTMSEAELQWLRSRLLGGKLEKAQHGALRFRRPAGLVLDPTGQVVLDPD